MSATQIRVDGVVLIISLLAASIIILLGTSFYILNNDIEVKLIADVNERLDEEGYQLSVDFDGRDGFIQGYAEDERAIKDIISIAESVDGVRTIESHLTINEEESSSPEDPIISNNSIDMIEDLTDIVEEGLKANNSNSSAPIGLGGITEPVPKDNPIETLPVESNLTEMTEKEISEEISVSFGVEQTDLSIEQELILHGLSEKLQLDPLLCIEMASFHEKSSIAISRTTKIKNYFEKQGIDQKRFDVIWHDSDKESKIQLKLFQNDINH